MNDISSDLKKQLAQCEEKYRILSETMQEVVWVLDVESKMFTYVSPSVQKLRGYSVAEIMAKPLDAALAKESQSKVSSLLQTRAEALRDGTIHSGEVFISEVEQPCKDGGTVWTEVLTSFHRKPDTGKIEVQGITRDISARRAAEEALREKTEDLSRYFSTALDLFCIADTDGYFQQLNDQWAVTLGYRQEDLAGHRFLDFIHPDDMEGTLQAIAQLKDQNEVLNFVNRYRCQDGSYRWIEWRSSPQGQKIYAAARDITERKVLEEELRQKSTLLERQMTELTQKIRLAGAVQRGIQQGDADEPSYIVRTIYQPIQTVSGDSYFYRYWPESQVLNGFVLDVTGHGIAAALQTSGMRVLLERELYLGEKITVEALERLNGQVGSYLQESAFVAAILFSLDYRTNVLTCISGGIHHFLAMQDETCSWITVHGSYLGISALGDFGVVEIPFHPGDAFFFVTDGITDQIGLSVPLGVSDFDGAVGVLEEVAARANRRDDCSALCICVK